MRIHEFQELMKSLYGQKDHERGIERTFLWFFEECGELVRAYRQNSNLEEEFADVLAWLCSLANLLDIDLETAALKKYNHVCPKCHQNPCICEEKFQPRKKIEI